MTKAEGPLPLNESYAGPGRPITLAKGRSKVTMKNTEISIAAWCLPQMWCSAADQYEKALCEIRTFSEGGVA